MTEKIYRWPKTVGGQVDRLYRLREERQALSKRVDLLKKEESALKEHLIQSISKERLQGARGRTAQFNFKPISRPTIEDMVRVCRWQVTKAGVIVLQRRLNEATVNALWEDGKATPGIGTFDDIKVSLTRLSR